MASLFNKDIESIKYVGSTTQRPIVTFSSGSGSGDIKMLIDSAAASFQRGASLKRFLNSGPALLLGKGQGTLTLTGLFGSADQLEALCGNADDPCSIARDITLSAGVLEDCDAGQSLLTDLVLHNCIVAGIQVTVSMQQDGILFQQANVTMTITDVSVA